MVCKPNRDSEWWKWGRWGMWQNCLSNQKQTIECSTIFGNASCRPEAKPFRPISQINNAGRNGDSRWPGWGASCNNVECIVQ